MTTNLNATDVALLRAAGPEVVRERARQLCEQGRAGESDCRLHLQELLEAASPDEVVVWELDDLLRVLDEEW